MLFKALISIRSKIPPTRAYYSHNRSAALRKQKMGGELPKEGTLRHPLSGWGAKEEYFKGES